MKVYALIGQSGTGKSYKVITVAKERDITYIIDDGLLIGGTRVIAGQSAKKENTRIASVRRALFHDPEHREKVKNALEEINPEKLLILGTSLKMVREICQVLGLPEPHKILRIEDVSTEKEIETAKKSRREDGKHVIPVPTFEIKKDFSGYFIDSLKIFRKKEKTTDMTEKTIIRPTFSYLGRYEISKSALIQVVEIAALKVEGVEKVKKVKIDAVDEGVTVNVELVLSLIKRLDLILIDVQKEVTKRLEYSTGLNVVEINAWAIGLSIMDKGIYIGES